MAPPSFISTPRRAYPGSAPGYRYVEELAALTALGASSKPRAWHRQGRVCGFLKAYRLRPDNLFAGNAPSCGGYTLRHLVPERIAS